MKMSARTADPSPQWASTRLEREARISGVVMSPPLTYAP
jgi:hypothetical protein